MVYRFVEKDGNAVRIGAIDCAELETKLQGYLDNGYAICEAELHDAQIINGLAASIELPAEPEIVVMPEVPREEQKTAE